MGPENQCHSLCFLLEVQSEILIPPWCVKYQVSLVGGNWEFWEALPFHRRHCDHKG